MIFTGCEVYGKCERSEMNWELWVFFEDIFKPVKITREGFKKSVPTLLNKK